ncbi:MAG: hypothetical protein ABI663_16695 [Chryseolinea sp.]
MYSRIRSFAKTIGVIVLSFTILLATGCTHVNMHSSSPGKSGSAPGQVKKTTGSQSAKPYAPGQQKKKH